MNLFLDDIRFPPRRAWWKIFTFRDSWVIARSYEQAVSLVEKRGFPNKVSFDHDLGEKESGMDFAHYLVNLDLDTGTMPKGFTYQIHSANPVGRDNIAGLLDGYLKHKNS